jgi:Putative auto-transporter adhesin, head GIN domain
MIRTLLVTAAGALALSVACFAGAAALGWPAGFSVEDIRDLVDRGGDWEEPVDDGSRVTRDIPWEGGDSLTFNASGNVRYTQGPTARMTVTGPNALVDRLVMDGDELRVPGRRMRGARLDIVVTAPAVNSFTINGSGTLDIEGFEQDELEIDVNGSGKITAQGAARRIDVAIRGSGDVDVSRVAGAEVELQVMGSGDARIAPTELADIKIMGAGDVDLVSDTARVDSNIMGAGRVNRITAPPPALAAPPGEAARKAPAARPAEAPPSVAP